MKEIYRHIQKGEGNIQAYRKMKEIYRHIQKYEGVACTGNIKDMETMKSIYKKHKEDMVNMKGTHKKLKKDMGNMKGTPKKHKAGHIQET
jgi:hypothetical protein